MEILLLWLILSILVGVYANSKGRSGIGMFIVSLLLLSPIVGFIIVAIMSNKSEEKKVNSGEMRKCDSCAELVKAEAKICRYCGNDMIIELTDVAGI